MRDVKSSRRKKRNAAPHFQPAFDVRGWATMESWQEAALFMRNYRDDKNKTPKTEERRN